MRKMQERSSTGDIHRDAGPRAPAPGERSAPTLRAKAARWFGRGFYACGKTGVPPQLDCLGGHYVLEKVFKHDFLAATALYQIGAVRPGLPRKVVAKTSRQTHFCLIPLGWLGRLVTRIEVRSLGRCEGISEVPRVLARPRPNVYVYQYIEGASLGDKPALPADFFDQLLAAIRQIHARNVVHFDLHKPGNILVDSDGSPHIIDFQLSMHIRERALLSRRLSRRLRLWLQSYDIYHVCKHKRRLQPDRLTEAEEQFSRNHSLPLRIHRAVAKPYKRVRRACLRFLHAKGILSAPDRPETCPETNPARWAKK
jgi:hypothetical protein